MKKMCFNWFAVGFFLLALCLLPAGCEGTNDDGVIDESIDNDDERNLLASEFKFYIQVEPGKTPEGSASESTAGAVSPSAGLVKSVAGAGEDWAAKAGIEDLTAQVVAVDMQGNIKGFSELTTGIKKNGFIKITLENTDTTYKFLVLMGLRDPAAEDLTLLMSGYKNTKPSAHSKMKIPVTMSPLVVDTKFVKKTTGAEPAIEKEPVARGLVTLDSQLKWDVKWTISGKGVTNLINAGWPTLITRNNTDLKLWKGGRWSTENTEKLFKRVEEVTSNLAKTVPGNIKVEIVGDISGFVSDTDINGAKIVVDTKSEEVFDYPVDAVNFNLKYVPFDKYEYVNWTDFGYTSSTPVWIIRNGLNDNPQDDETVLEVDKDWKTASAAGKNGNGSVRFKVENQQRYWLAEVTDDWEYVGPVEPGKGPSWYEPKRGSFEDSAGRTWLWVLIGVSVWDAYRNRLLTTEESNAVLEFKVDRDHIVSAKAEIVKGPGPWTYPLLEDYHSNPSFADNVDISPDSNGTKKLVFEMDGSDFVSCVSHVPVKVTFGDWTETYDVVTFANIKNSYQ